MAQVVIRNLNKTFDNDVRAVKDVNLEIRDQEFVVLVGPSGCGKTTTLRMIAGLEAISSGDISIDGNVVNQLAPMDRDIAMVFQNYALYPHMTVFENLAFGLKLRKVPRDDTRKRVEAAAAALGIERYLARRPRELSGGERQRVALGRAMVREPKVFLFDEPLSNLDARLRVEMRSEIRRLHHRVGATMIYVTHDQVEAMTMGDRIAVLNRGQLQQVADPRTLYTRPANTFVAGFIGTPPVNLFEARVQEYGASVEVGGALWRVGEAQRAALAGRSGAAVTVGVRPEDLHQDEKGVPATLEVVEPLGSETLLYWKSTAGNHVSRATSGETPAVGARATLAARPDGVLLFEPATGAALLAPRGPEAPQAPMPR